MVSGRCGLFEDSLEGAWTAWGPWGLRAWRTQLMDSAQRILRNQCDSTIAGWQTTLSCQQWRFYPDCTDWQVPLDCGVEHWLRMWYCQCVQHGDYMPDLCSTFRLVNIQRQPNSSDCGLFAATELVHGKNPILSYWDTSKKCLEQEKIECFPQDKERTVLCSQRQAWSSVIAASNGSMKTVWALMRASRVKNTGSVTTAYSVIMFSLIVYSLYSKYPMTMLYL